MTHELRYTNTEANQESIVPRQRRKLFVQLICFYKTEPVKDGQMTRH